MATRPAHPNSRTRVRADTSAPDAGGSMEKRMHVPRVACLALLFILVFAGCAAPPATTSAPPTSVLGTQVSATPAPVLTDLQGPDELKAQFNQDSGLPRIILLASPT